MKIIQKTALAFLIATFLITPVWAQTSIYGQLDIGYGKGNGGKAERNEKFQQRGGGKNATFVGVRGKEQINNDMHVFFELESEFNLEDGSSQKFNRSAYIGVASNWGSVLLGRQRSVVYETLSQFDIGQEFAASYASRNTNLYAFGFSMNGRDQSRSNSMVSYYTPRIHGIKLGASLVLKNDDIWQQKEYARDIVELGADYKYENLTLGAAYRSKPYKSADAHLALPGSTPNRKAMNGAWGLAAKYKWNSIELSAGYIDDHVREDGKGYFVGATYATGPYKIGGQFVHNTYKGADRKQPLAASLYGRYALSPRSSFYVLFGMIDGDAKDALQASHKNSFGFGFTHRF